jgi:hypothetical protein
MSFVIFNISFEVDESPSSVEKMILASGWKMTHSTSKSENVIYVQLWAVQLWAVQLWAVQLWAVQLWAVQLWAVQLWAVQLWAVQL